MNNKLEGKTLYDLTVNPCGEGGNSPINHNKKGRSIEAGGNATEWWCCHSRRYSDATIHS
jgi:hypothetical protein